MVTAVAAHAGVVAEFVEALENRLLLFCRKRANTAPSSSNCLTCISCIRIEGHEKVQCVALLRVYSPILIL